MDLKFINIIIFILNIIIFIIIESVNMKNSFICVINIIIFIIINIINKIINKFEKILLLILKNIIICIKKFYHIFCENKT